MAIQREEHNKDEVGSQVSSAVTMVVAELDQNAIDRKLDKYTRSKSAAGSGGNGAGAGVLYALNLLGFIVFYVTVLQD